MNDSPGAPAQMRWRWLDWPANARRAAAASYLALLTWALLAPASTFDAIDQAFPHQDKVAHGAIFLALALLVRWALPAAWGSGRRRVAALAALVCYGASMEALQALLVTSQRTFEWQDMACNQAGLCAGWLLFASAVAARGTLRRGAGRGRGRAVFRAGHGTARPGHPVGPDGGGPRASRGRTPHPPPPCAPLVLGGGTLIYSTCSSEPDENEAVVAAFLADAPGFTLRQTHQTTPPEDGLEAFYGAVLVRNV